MSDRKYFGSVCLCSSCSRKVLTFRAGDLPNRVTVDHASRRICFIFCGVLMKDSAQKYPRDCLERDQALEDDQPQVEHRRCPIHTAPLRERFTKGPK